MRKHRIEAVLRRRHTRPQKRQVCPALPPPLPGLAGREFPGTCREHPDRPVRGEGGLGREGSWRGATDPATDPPQVSRASAVILRAATGTVTTKVNEIRHGPSFSAESPTEVRFVTVLAP